MIRYVFDASAIINLIKKGVIEIFAEGKTLDLALYECLHAIYKEFILRRIDKETSCRYIRILIRVFFELLEVDSIGSEDIEKVFYLTLKECLKIYDAAYLYIAIRDKLTLVTDDKSLKNVASRHVKVLSTEELLRKNV